MLLWFLGFAFVAVWVVFKDPAIDHRFLFAGALVPDLVDVWTGGRWVGHTVLAGIVVLTVVMLGTRGRRLLRRRLLFVPIGMLLHLVADGAFDDTGAFWWPIGGGELDGDLPSVARGWANVPLELLGLAALAWAYKRFRLAEPERRAYFWRTGRIGRDLVR